MEYIEKLHALRALMKEHQLNAYIVPITDPHIGEYVPDHWKCIEWLTGFTGSAGTVVVTEEFAGLWTDSRYFIQAEEQLQGSGFQLMKLTKPHTPEFIDWLSDNLSAGAKISYDGRVVSIGLHKQIISVLQALNMEFRMDLDLIGMLWKDRPELPDSKVFVHDIFFSGQSRRDKLSVIRQEMQKQRLDYQLLTALDDIAWTLNLRGNDVQYSPLFVSYALVGLKDCFLFIGEEKLNENIQQEMTDDGITIHPYVQITDVLSTIPGESRIFLSPKTLNCWLYNAIPKAVEKVEGISIATMLKAVKNDREIEHIRNVMIKDGVALTRFFIWLEERLGKERITEVSAGEKVMQYRSVQENFRGPSFTPISAYNAHGASPHYEPTEESDIELKKDGIYLLDSGGQYLDGTTDVTRTIALGDPTPKQRSDFTLALKGTINLAMAEFPLGTKGYQIEILARKALWENGLNYGHGTGHGVGFFLNVHEGPQTIGTGASGDMSVIFEPGMLTADEPAIYREGEYGFRTENLILCIEGKQSDYGQFLRFETVTLCYIDTKLVEKELMTDCEINWFNKYHQMVYNKLSPHLGKSEKEWLKEKTQPI